MRMLFRIVVSGILLATVGCLHPQGRRVAESTVPIEILYSAVVSPGTSTTPRVRWIGTPKKLTDQWMALHGHRLGAASPPPPAVDWETSAVLLVQMGSKPTGGYGLELMHTQAGVKGGSATVSLNWIEPSPSTISTQVITHPCLLLEMKRGEYQSVMVVDQSGQLRARVRLE
jgi:hypothetical protein